ncbi:hypothetical protein [Indioceanicola profundi]|uniref:hypothetical protein n=1 Tax=Indioceanicola profundi TaxID=2220096 RepID=UPI0013C4E081|nr:hypothetical protein [Indioceanicola profundi]
MSCGSVVEVRTWMSPAAVRIVAVPSFCATTCPPMATGRERPASFAGTAWTWTVASGMKPAGGALPGRAGAPACVGTGEAFTAGALPLRPIGPG